MAGYVLDLAEVDQTQSALVGGKGANLGELARIPGIREPSGFCVTTVAFRRITEGTPSFGDRLDDLERLGPNHLVAVRTCSSEIRRALERTTIPDDLLAAVTTALAPFGPEAAFAVRSSATAEDLPTASFAGQHDTYLNIVGPVAVLEHVRRCWASLFTERAVAYRIHHRISQASVAMAVVVQEMAVPRASGVMFTADPVTSNRRVVSVDAGFGLGEALVSGTVQPDHCTVQDGVIATRTIGEKHLAVEALPGGGTRERTVGPRDRIRPAVTDAQAVQLAELGRRIESHFGRPQDIEWCLVDGGFEIVQSRPITTLFPIPEIGDEGNHVFLSVGHQQMMTDPMKPLGLSMWRLTALPPMHEAGGRLFVDVAPRLASPASRADLLDLMGRSDPLIRDALETVLERGFIPLIPDEAPTGPPPAGAPTPIETDPAIVTDLIGRNEESVASLQREIGTKSGPDLLDCILADIPEMKRLLFDPRSHQVFMSAMDATWWLNDHLEAWLGEKNAADTLTQSVPHNVTSEMGLALLDVADVIRPYPEVVALLQEVGDEDFLDRLDTVTGGTEAQDAITRFLDRYGMRCVGEIDITRQRWSEHPAALVPVILGNIKNFEQGGGARRFEQGRREALDREQDLLERLRLLPDGEWRAGEVKEKINLVRTFIGYREYPKYGMVRRYFVYKQALLEEAGRLVESGVLQDEEDIYFLTFDELQDVVRTHRVDRQLIRRRAEAFESYRMLTPPRVLTSDGEAVTGDYHRHDVPDGALVGLPVSAGTAEGRARVVSDMSDADLDAGDILVTAFTDPSWTPLFVTVAGIVTEVGGHMTHGAVIAREYGLPAVVGVEHATTMIRDGGRIRVHGTEGYVEILD